MTFPFSEDAANIFEGGDFGTASLVVGTSTSTLYGMFDQAYQDALGIEGQAPVFTCAEASIGSARHGSTLVVGTSTYTISEIRRDGIGNAAFRLRQ